MESLAITFKYLAIFIAIYLITRPLLHKFKNLPPSPFLSLPLLGHLPLVFRQRVPLFRSLAALSRCHGPVLFLHFGTRPVLVLSSPAAIQECLSTQNDVVFADRPHLLSGKYAGDNYTSLIWASYGPQWRNLRRISIVEILSTHQLNLLSKIRAEEVHSLIHRLRSKNGMVEMKSMLFSMTLNNMMRMITGKKLIYDEDEDKSEDRKMARRFQEIVEATFKLGGATNTGDFLPRILRWIGIVGEERKLRRLNEEMHEFMKVLMEEHRRMEKEGNLPEERKNAMIDAMMELQKSDPIYYTNHLIRVFLQSLLAAGTETSATTMEWTLSLLLNHPDILHKAQSELDHQVGHDRLVKESDLTHLPYLHCIINESMRLYQTAPLAVPPPILCRLHRCWVPRPTRDHDAL